MNVPLFGQGLLIGFSIVAPVAAPVAATRERVTAGALRWVNRLSDAIIVAFGIAALWSAARSNA